MSRKAFFLIYLVVACLAGYSQNNGTLYQPFTTFKPNCDSCKQELSLNFESTSFVKNNEYTNNFTQGFTGIGFLVKPTLEYYFTPSTKVNLGYYFLKYSGIGEFSEAIPIFTVQQNLGKNLTLVFGSIYGTLNHQIREPLFRFDRYYQDNVEYGIQLLYNTQQIDFDIWLDWENYIFKNDLNPEKIKAGAVADFTLISTDKFETHIPAQLLYYHIGGEIDTSGISGYSLYNGMTGVRFQYNFSSSSLISLEPSIYFFDDVNSKQNPQPFASGQGYYINLGYQNKYLGTTLGYWQSDNFFAPNGEYLFLSTSDYDLAFSQNRRELITGKLSANFDITSSIRMALNFDGYFDIMSSNFDHSVGFYFVIDESFFIKKLKTKSQPQLSRN